MNNIQQSLEQEARELVESFYQINDMNIDSGGTNPYISRAYAKQCAISFCDEILNKFGLISEGKQHFAASATIQHYEELKECIQTKL